MKVSLKATGALIYLGKGKVVLHRPDIITISVHASRILTINSRTGRVVNEAPNSVITIHPLGSNIVTSFGVATGVLRRFVGGTMGPKVFDGPEIVVYVPSNIARIREGTIRSTTCRTNTGPPIILVRRPVTTTVNTNVPISRPYKDVMISVNKNADRITMVSLNSVIATYSMEITKSGFSRTVSACIGEGCGLLVNREATRSVGVGVNSTCPNRRRGGLIIGNEGLISKLPGSVAVSSTRIERTLTSPLTAVIRTVEAALRGAPPRLSTSVVSRNVVLANNNTLLGKLSVLIVRRANVPIRVTREPLSYIISNTNGELNGPLNIRCGRSEWCRSAGWNQTS